MCFKFCVLCVYIEGGLRLGDFGICSRSCFFVVIYKGIGLCFEISVSYALCFLCLYLGVTPFVFHSCFII